jgi:ankyrin repeat protein
MTIIFIYQQLAVNNTYFTLDTILDLFYEHCPHETVSALLPKACLISNTQFIQKLISLCPAGVLTVDPLSQEILLHKIAKINVTELYKENRSVPKVKCHKTAKEYIKQFEENSKYVLSLPLLMCRIILEVENIDVNAQDINGDTPLHVALRNRSQDIATAIAEHPNINLKIKNNLGETCMHVLADISKGSAKRAIPSIFSLFQTHFCIEKKQKNRLRYFYGWMREENIKHLQDFTFTGTDKEQWMKFFIDSDCNIDEQDNDGNTPLHNALLQEEAPFVEYLMVDLQADLEIANNKGWRPISMLVGKSSFTKTSVQTLLEIMIEADIPLNTLSPKGDTLLHLACKQGHNNVIKYLQDCNADEKYANHKFDVNAENNKGMTALKHCVVYDYVTCVEALFRRTKDLNITKGITTEEWGEFLSRRFTERQIDNPKLIIAIIEALNKIAKSDQAKDYFANDINKGEPSLFRSETEDSHCSIVSCFSCSTDFYSCI